MKFIKQEIILKEFYGTNWKTNPEYWKEWRLIHDEMIDKLEKFNFEKL